MKLVRGCVNLSLTPDLVYVTSLYTWAWKPVWQAVRFYKSVFPKADVWLGGVYASLMPEHAAQSGVDHVHVGVFDEAENLMPAYDLVPEWDGSIVFSSRGCNNRCPYCAVWRIEGKLNSCKQSIRHLIYPKHSRIILWDNNILQSPYWEDIFDELIWFCKAKGMRVDFNQGLDARLITEDVAEKLAQMRLMCVRLSYDRDEMEPHVESAIEMLSKIGIRRRSIFVYVLYNFDDDPESFFRRVSNVLNCGAVVYPMRFEPLNALERWKYVGPRWTKEKLEVVEDFRRVYGYGGTFPPYEWLVERFRKAACFDEAFKLPREGEHEKRANKPYHARWQREADWRKVVSHILSKQW
ncbi:MAG: hypothetical protein QXN87_08115 [Candidatus Bathyarchaeia archaeon]